MKILISGGHAYRLEKGRLVRNEIKLNRSGYVVDTGKGYKLDLRTATPEGKKVLNRIKEELKYEKK